MRKRSGPGKSRRPARGAHQAPGHAAPEVPPELQPILDQVRTLVRECPEGWGVVAEVLRQDPDLDPDPLLELFARTLGKESLPLLRGLGLDEDEDLAHAALRALPLLGTRAAAEALAEVYAAFPEDERGRLAAQGVAALQSRGIQVTLPEHAGPRQAVPAYRLRETWESMPDGVGSRQTMARFQDRYGVWHALMLVWNDRAGVKDGFMDPYSRREWEGMLEMTGTQGIVNLQVPPDYARWHIAQARAVNAVSGLPIEDNLDDWDRLMGPPPEGYSPPDPLESVRTLAAEERVALVQQLENLLDEPFFESWALEPADCRPWLKQYRRIEAAAGPDASYAAALAELCAEVARKLVTPEVAALYRERLLDVARKCEWMHEDEQAEVAAAAVLDIDAARNPGEAAFFREMALNGLSVLEEMLAAGVDPEAERYDPLRVID